MEKPWQRPDSAEASADSTSERLERPRRRCRQHTNAFIEEQLLEDREEFEQLTDQRTSRMKEKNKRAQQRFRERQKEKSQQAAVQVTKLQHLVEELKSRAIAAEQRCQLLEKLSVLEKVELASFQPEAKARSVQIFTPFDGFTALPEEEFIMQLKGCSPTPRLISCEQVQAMEFEEHVLCWRAYIDEMASALQESHGNPSSRAAQHLQGLTDELLAWCAWLNNLSPHVLPKMRSLRLDTATPAEPPHPSKILEVLKSQGLTTEQIQQMVAARKFCLATLANLMRERLSMQDVLKGVISGGSSWSNMHDSHATMVEVQQRLARNVKAESHAFHTFMSSALRRVLNPIQTAMLLVGSFPFMPSIMSVVACLSGEEAEEGSDEDLLELDPIPVPESPSLVLEPADSLKTSLDALWNDIFLT